MFLPEPVPAPEHLASNPPTTSAAHSVDVSPWKSGLSQFHGCSGRSNISCPIHPGRSMPLYYDDCWRWLRCSSENWFKELQLCDVFEANKMVLLLSQILVCLGNPSSRGNGLPGCQAQQQSCPASAKKSPLPLFQPTLQAGENATIKFLKFHVAFLNNDNWLRSSHFCSPEAFVGYLHQPSFKINKTTRMIACHFKNFIRWRWPLWHTSAWPPETQTEIEDLVVAPNFPSSRSALSRGVWVETSIKPCRIVVKPAPFENTRGISRHQVLGLIKSVQRLGTIFRLRASLCRRNAMGLSAAASWCMRWTCSTASGESPQETSQFISDDNSKKIELSLFGLSNYLGPSINIFAAIALTEFGI